MNLALLAAALCMLSTDCLASDEVGYRIHYHPFSTGDVSIDFFKKSDSDGDKRINFDEYVRLDKDLMRQRKNEFAKLDINGDGELDLSEFLLIGGVRRPLRIKKPAGSGEKKIDDVTQTETSQHKKNTPRYSSEDADELTTKPSYRHSKSRKAIVHPAVLNNEFKRVVEELRASSTSSTAPPKKFSRDDDGSLDLQDQLDDSSSSEEETTKTTLTTTTSPIVHRRKAKKQHKEATESSKSLLHVSKLTDVKLQRYLKKFDDNGDGYLNRREAILYIQNWLECALLGSIDEVFARYDRDSDERLSWPEVMRLTAERQADLLEPLVDGELSSSTEELNEFGFVSEGGFDLPERKEKRRSKAKTEEKKKWKVDESAEEDSREGGEKRRRLRTHVGYPNPA